jgi:hypothetical protein
MKKVASSMHVAPNLTMADFTKVLVTNVVLATAVVVLVFHAPLAYAGLGAAVAGLLIWARARRALARRTR